MAVSFKFPGCAASLVFDADNQMMTCEYCGKVISPADVEAQMSILSGEAMKEEDKRDAELREPDASVSATDTGAGSPAAATSTHAPAAEQPLWSSEYMQYVCNSCGATVITDQNTAATFCAFCGSPTIIAERLAEERAPDFVLPFQYGRDTAIDCFFEWCNAGRFTPVQFIRKENIEKMTGLYVPFWLFDSAAEMRIEASGKKVATSTTGRKTITTTSYFRIIRNRHLDWNKIPLDGATRIDDKLMEVIEPYDYVDLEPFSMKYLAGFFADKYDLTADKLSGRLNDRLSVYADKIFKESVSAYSTVSIENNETVYRAPTFHYALMPVWILNYKYLGKTYTFAMNGQTGKIAGEPPVSLVKLVVLALAVLPLAAFICRFIGWLILGGLLT